jgi:hypothetical protein
MVASPCRCKNINICPIEESAENGADFMHDPLSLWLYYTKIIL